jgi:hypothetical protein
VYVYVVSATSKAGMKNVRLVYEAEAAAALVGRESETARRLKPGHFPSLFTSSCDTFYFSHFASSTPFM